MLTPTAARAFWLALLDNAARIVVESDSLFPSPRAQSLVVLAQEEVGKAVWVYKTFFNAWDDRDETPREVPELHKKGLRHLAKLMEAIDFGAEFVEVPGWSGLPEIELVREHTPDLLDAYLESQAQEDNEAKKRGFYVDLQADGSFVVPHEVDRPFLRSQIWSTADMIKWCIVEDQFIASISGRTLSSTEQQIEALLEPVLAQGA